MRNANDTRRYFLCYHLIFTQHLERQAVMPENMHTWSSENVDVLLCQTKTFHNIYGYVCVFGARARTSVCP